MSAKEAVYAALPADAEVVRAYKEGRLEETAAKVLDSCAGLDGSEMYTVLLHYLLAITGVPSQRKVEAGGAQIDIVVPDLATLRRRPSAALVVCVCGTAEAESRARESAGAQPDPRNVWMACPEAVSGYRTFSGARIGALPGEAARFLERAGSGRLRVLGARS